MTDSSADFLLRHASLRQLQVFEMVARTRGYGRAAEALCMTQPSVSAHVKKLCDAVGLPLFERVGNERRLTLAGQRVLAASEDVIERLDRLQHDLIELKTEVRGTLSIGVVSTAKYFMPQLLGAFLHAYPGVEPQLTVTNRAKILGRLRNNEHDFIIMGQVPDEIEVEAESFLDNRVVVIANPGHPLVRRRSISLARLAQERFLSREPGSGTRLAVDKVFSGVEPQLSPYMELGSIEAIKQGVMAGLGLSVLPMHSLRLELDGGYLAVLDVEGFPLQRRWHAVHLKGKTLSLVARTFLGFLLEQGERVLADTPQPGG